MGVDKATLVVVGKPMADRVIDALARAGAEPTARVGGPAGEVADMHPGEGPLGGVLSALAWSPHEITVVAPCDLLAPSPSAFASLAAALADAPSAGAAVVAPDQPLPAAFRAGACDVLARAFAGGERSLRQALGAVHLVTVALPPDAIADADTPADLPPGGR